VREEGINNLQPGEVSDCEIYGGIVGYSIRANENCERKQDCSAAPPLLFFLEHLR
jgi:hypothetical protein